MYVIYVCVHLLSTRTDFRKTRPAVYAVVEMKFEFIAHPFSLFKQTERYGVYAYCRALCLCNKKQCIEKKKKITLEHLLLLRHGHIRRCCKKK